MNTEEATEKQIKFANQLGIANPSNYSKQTLKELIDQKIKERDAKAGKTQPEAQKQEIQASRHDIVVSRVEKPHSYEFGKATARHKIFYNVVEELKAHIKALEETGLIEPEEIKMPGVG